MLLGFKQLDLFRKKINPSDESNTAITSPKKKPPFMPSKAYLTAIEELWDIEYSFTNEERIVLEEISDNTISITGAVKELNLCRGVLRKWLFIKTKQKLIPWLTTLSHDTGLYFNNVRVRGQKTRWASCSSGKNINLNFKLLFLPPHLTRYILIHELCHLKHLNHSKNYWNFVASFEPRHKLFEKELKNSPKLIPGWVHQL